MATRKFTSAWTSVLRAGVWSPDCSTAASCSSKRCIASRTAACCSATRCTGTCCSLWNNITAGLRAAAAKYGDRIASVGVDTWGVDFGLLGPQRRAARQSVSLSRSPAPTACLDASVPQAFRAKRSSPQTGLQFMEFNTLYQLLAMQLQNSPLLDMAESFLMMPDLFHWLLTGVKANEIHRTPRRRSSSTRTTRRLVARAARQASTCRRRCFGTIVAARHEARQAASEPSPKTRASATSTWSCPARTTRRAP